MILFCYYYINGRRFVINEFKKINLSHLYFTKLRLGQLFNTKSKFASYKSFDLSKGSTDISFADIVFIEITKLTKSSVKMLNDVVKKNSSKEIYIFCEDVENKFLLKFALHFSLNKLNLLNDNKDDIEKILVEATKKVEIKKDEKNQIEISRKLNSFFSLIMFHKHEIIFANEKTKELFNTKKLSDIKDIIKNSEEIYSLLTQNENKKQNIVMENSDGEEWSYGFYLDVFKNNNDKLLTIIPENRVEDTEAFLSTINRFKFIENLKDRLAQNSVEQIPMSIVCINISNYQKLLESSGSMVIHDFIKKFIEKLCFYKDSCQGLSQWNPHFFLFLIERDSFENVKQQLDSMHQKLIYSEVDDMVSPIITSSALSIEKLDINDIIDSIEEISSHDFKSNDFNSCDYFEINHFNDYMEEDEQIYHYFQSCIANQTSLKLLNIYKGLCINTASKILKIKENSYFLHCENLQAYSMKFDSRTIIQSPDLPKDVEADIKYINIEKQYAIVENLKYLEFSANNRQHTRVQPSIRMPLTFKYGKYSYQGEILDISTQAIAIKFNHSLSDELNSKEVELQFKIPDDSMNEGFAFMDVTGKVVNVSEVDVTKCKIVVMIDLEAPYDSYMLKYMYDRQKQLILELKRAVKVQSRRN